jgi:hypothetical protein
MTNVNMCFRFVGSTSQYGETDPSSCHQFPQHPRSLPIKKSCNHNISLSCSLKSMINRGLFLLLCCVLDVYFENLFHFLGWCRTQIQNEKESTLRYIFLCSFFMKHKLTFCWIDINSVDFWKVTEMVNIVICITEDWPFY